MNGAIVIGVDPGRTTGIGVLSCGISGVAPESLNPFGLQVRGDAIVRPIVEALADHWSQSRPLLAVEQFVVSTRAARSGHAHAGRLARALIAELQTLALDHANGTALEVQVRPAATVKPWATDRRLAAAGLLEASEGMPHARDAFRHALYAAVHEGVAGDPLSAAGVG